MVATGSSALTLCLGDASVSSGSTSADTLKFSQHLNGTGLLVFGAGGVKTDYYVQELARQVVRWRSADQPRPAFLFLGADPEVACDLQRVADEAGRGADFRLLSLDEDLLHWNPLDLPWLSSFALGRLLVSLETSGIDDVPWSFNRPQADRLMQMVITAYRLVGREPLTFSDLYESLLVEMGIPVKWNSVSGDLEHGFRRSGTLVGA